ncbi:MAG: hypothetical protein LBD06_12790, partial [Candidatus Accumulibacter sp.]|nr:hypothetical protein [Accumulibacter sp.]
IPGLPSSSSQRKSSHLFHIHTTCLNIYLNHPIHWLVQRFPRIFHRQIYFIRCSFQSMPDPSDNAQKREPKPENDLIRHERDFQPESGLF